MNVTKKIGARIGTLLLVVAMMFGTSLSVLAATTTVHENVAETVNSYEVMPAEAGNTQATGTIRAGQTATYNVHLSNEEGKSKTFYLGTTPASPVKTGNVKVTLFNTEGKFLHSWYFFGTKIDSWESVNFGVAATGDYKIMVENQCDVSVYFTAGWGA